MRTLKKKVTKIADLMEVFSDHDWNGFAGAEEFDDGSQPMIGHTKTGTFVLDNNGIFFTEVTEDFAQRDAQLVFKSEYKNPSIRTDVNKKIGLAVLRTFKEDVTFEQLVDFGFVEFY